MNDYDVVITEVAQQDLREIIGAILKVFKNVLLAQKSITKIGLAISNLEKAPFGNYLVNDERLVTMGIRKLMIDKYIVFFIASEKDKSVSVVRIIHDQRYWVGLI